MQTTLFDLAKPYPINTDQSAQYRHDGHILLHSVAGHEEIDYYGPLITNLVRKYAGERSIQVTPGITQTLFHELSNVWQKDEEVREFVFAKRFARIASELMGVKAVRLYHDGALVKEPGGYPSPWHKDHYNWPLVTRHTVKMWLALDDIHREMGAMRFASGSHRAGQFPEVHPSYESDQLFERIMRDHRTPVVSYDMKAGDAVFFSGQLLHSALANSSDEPRQVLSVIYFEDGTRVMEPDHKHRMIDKEQFLPGLKPGEVAAGDLNPILYSAEE